MLMMSMRFFVFGDHNAERTSRLNKLRQIEMRPQRRCTPVTIGSSGPGRSNLENTFFG